jgi:hypothetical protein
MSKRLQVLLADAEFRAIRRIARRKQSTVADWVRGALRAAQQGESTGSAAAKLEAVRAAAGHAFPTGDIEDMLADIERGAIGDGAR